MPTNKANRIEDSGATRAPLKFARQIEEPMTSVIIKVPGGYIGVVEEIEGAFTQGNTVEEVRENLVEVVQLMIQTQREATRKEIAGENHKTVLKEKLGKIVL